MDHLGVRGAGVQRCRGAGSEVGEGWDKVEVGLYKVVWGGVRLRWGG